MSVAAPNTRGVHRFGGPALLLGIVLFLFGPTLLHPDRVISARNGDIAEQFIGWRMFAFDAISRGHWPLWNPYLFCGQSFVGNWQAAMFYPPNYLHLILPMGTALTLITGLHVFLAGLTMHAWLRFKGISPLASTVGGATFMLSGPVLGHVFPGHVTWMCAVAWTPAIFHAAEGHLTTRRALYLWLGAGALAMQILAGYPQPAYITLVGVALFVILKLRFDNVRAVPGLAGGLLLGVALAAIQFLPGVEAGLESNRAAGTSWEYATEYAVPLRNFLLALAPSAMGRLGNNTTRHVMLWEALPYAGVVSLILSLATAVLVRRTTRTLAGPLALLFAFAALGGGVYWMIYTYLPGGSSFRVPGRWLLLSALFIAVLAAHALDGLALPRVRWAVAGGGVASAAALAYFAVRTGTGGPDDFSPPALLLSAGLCMGVVIATRLPRANCVLAFLSIAQLTWFAHACLPASSARLYLPEDWVRIAESLPKDARIQIQGAGFADFPLWVQRPGLTGYDPLQARRYVEFMAATQGKDPRTVPEIFGPQAPQPAWKLLRAAVAIDPKGNFGLLEGGLPHAFLADDVIVVPERSRRLAALMSPAFDGRKLALVESETGLPDVAPDVAPGGAEVTADTGDTLDIAVDCVRPALLVVTDSYARGWRAVRADTGVELPVVPADHVLRGVVVSAGRYVIRMEYRPTSFVIGRWVSLAALLAYVAWGGWLVWRKRARNIPI